MTTLTESVVEDAALGWLKNLGWSVAHGPDIAPDTLNAERTDYGQVVLEKRLRDSLVRLNPDLPAEALDSTANIATPTNQTKRSSKRPTIQSPTMSPMGLFYTEDSVLAAAYMTIRPNEEIFILVRQVHNHARTL